MRKLICVCLAVMLLAGVCIACAEEKIIEVENKVPIPKLAPKDRAAAAGESPFTGLPASGEAYTPIMVPLDNSPEGHPLWGIGDASVLFPVPAFRLCRRSPVSKTDTRNNPDSSRSSRLPEYPPSLRDILHLPFWPHRPVHCIPIRLQRRPLYR